TRDRVTCRACHRTCSARLGNDHQARASLLLAASMERALRRQRIRFLVKLIGNFLNSGLCASFILISACCASNAYRADDFISSLDRQASLKSNDAVYCCECRGGRISDALRKCAARGSERGRGERLPSARFNEVRVPAIVAQSNLYPAGSIHYCYRYVIVVFPAFSYRSCCNLLGQAQRDLLFSEHLLCNGRVRRRG